MRVLIAIDGSDDGFEAVRQAALLVAPEKDEIALYYSVPDISVKAEPTPQCTTVDKMHGALAEAVFEKARKYLSSDLARHAQDIVDSTDPREGIVAAAERAKADMIVVGARGLSPLARLLLGSVSRSVVHTARVPVLVARRPKTLAQNDGLRVLVACDRPGTATAMAQLVCNLTWPTGTQGYSITVLAGLLVGQVPAWLEERTRSPAITALTQVWVGEQQEEFRRTKGKLAEFCRCLPDAFQQNPIAVNGHPADKILEMIDRGNIDLVIVGAKRMGTIERFVVGSTSEAVLNHAPCSVLIIRDKDSVKQY